MAAFCSLRCDPWNQGGMALRMLILRAGAGVCVCLAGSGVRGAPLSGPLHWLTMEMLAQEKQSIQVPGVVGGGGGCAS